MDKLREVKNAIGMKIEDPFWNEKFSDNLPKWIHIWVATIGIGSGILFILNSMFKMVDGDNSIVRLIGLMGLISLILLVLNRDTYLPFLAENFVPEKFLKLEERIPKNPEQQITVKVAPKSKVIYWAADPGKEVNPTWQKGYGKFENSGVVTSDANGNAIIPIICPSRYIVHGYKILPKHVHYRCYNKNTQMLSRIQTAVLTDLCK
jgi:hypothetical protein